MADGIVVINAGSSSIKFALFVIDGQRDLERRFRGLLGGIGSDPYFAVKNDAGETIDERDEWPRGSPFNHTDAIRYILDWLMQAETDMRVIGAGHRVVHGGQTFDGPVRVDPAVLAQLEQLSPLAPLHQPHNLAGIRAVAEASPTLPQVACFDTAFHHGQPHLAHLFALPRKLTESGIRRYGFHGLSYEYIARRMPEYAHGVRRVVVAHLGSGASMCAMRDGHSVDSTMGFTAVDGLPMGTRTGALDPGVVLYLLQQRGYDAAKIEELLYEQSGLLGVSEISNDMRDLEASDDPRAVEAIDLFVYQIVRYLGALTAVLGGLDALVFTAGIGENSPLVRRRVCAQASWLGITLDPAANDAGGPRISTPDSKVTVMVIPTNEERMIARHTLDLISG
jgi:acetate kinase